MLVANLKLLLESFLREFTSTRPTVFAPTTTWWHTSNKPGSMGNEFCWGAKLVAITCGGEETVGIGWETVKKLELTEEIGIRTINLMIKPFLVGEKPIPCGKFGQHIVN
jgi:hypothetical protein